MARTGDFCVAADPLPFFSACRPPLLSVPVEGEAVKLLIITSSYSKYLEDFYGRRPGLSSLSYAEQKKAYEQDAFGWTSCWSEVLAGYGYEVLDIVWNAEPMQRAWARENGRSDCAALDLKQIALLQAKKMMPDVVWFDDCDAGLLKTLRREIPSLRAVLGWVGSAIPKTDAWRDMDLILSCAPESVAALRNSGFPAAGFAHSFDPRINARLASRAKSVDLSFVGQLMRFSDFHLQRDALLERLATRVSLQIYSPNTCFGRQDEVKAQIKVAVCRVMRLLRVLGFPESLLRSVPILGIVAGLTPDQCLPVNPRLKPFMKGPVFGLEMFQLLADSLLTLNIHADSSPEFASNMRLYEVTGAGSCLVTDWRQNLQELFEADSEVVVYRSAEECLEKVKWLLDNRQAALEIGKAGQLRTLNNYTFAHRAPQLVGIIEKACAARKNFSSQAAQAVAAGKAS